MTLNGVWPCSLHYFAELGIAFGAHYVNVVEVTPILSAPEM